MKRVLVLLTLVLATFLALDSGGGAKEEEASPPDPARALEAAIDAGKASLVEVDWPTDRTWEDNFTLKKD